MSGKGYGDWLEDLKGRLNIVDVVSHYVPLEQKGRNYWGRCPFHHEKTPSFAVNPDRQAYKCFGCGAGGDAIKFVEEIESVDFMGAVKILADRVGFVIPEFSKGSLEELAKRKERKQRLLAALKAAARFYYASLASPKAEKAHAYMRRRGISPQLAKAFGLGFSPGWEELIAALNAQGFENDLLQEAGLAYCKSGRWLDALANRLIFPIIDSLGNVLAFGGRELEDSGFAKYKNTTATPVFDKSKTLYNINLVKKLQRESGLESLIVVEGYMDALSLYAAGFRNVVASMGTSLTPSQAALMKRMVDKVSICYDGDAAGQKATMRGLELLRETGLEVRVVELPEGMDPDDVVRKRGGEAYAGLLEAALPLTDYKLKRIRAGLDLGKADEKRKYVQAALKVIATLATSTEREDYLKQIKADTGFTFEALKSDLERLESGEKPQDSKTVPPPRTGSDKAVRFILYEMLQGKPFANLKDDLSQFITGNVHRIVYEYARSLYAKGGDVNLNLLYDYVGEEGRAELDGILESSGINLGAGEERYFADCVALFKRESLELQIDILTRQLECESDEKTREGIARMIKEHALRLQQLK